MSKKSRSRTDEKRDPKTVAFWSFMAVALVVVAGGYWASTERVANAGGDYVSTYVPAQGPSVPELGVPPTSADAAFAVDFGSVPSGDVPDSLKGLAASTVETDRNTKPMHINAGRLAHGAPTGQHAASYLEVGQGAPVTRIGATATFPAGNSGSIALVAWQSSLDEAMGKGERIPNGGIHFVATGTDWHLGVWDSAAGAETVLMSGSVISQPDTPVSFEVVRDGATATVIDPAGNRQNVTDSRIGDWTGRWATWELYEYDPSKVPASFAQTWAI